LNGGDVDLRQQNSRNLSPTCPLHEHRLFIILLISSKQKDSRMTKSTNMTTKAAARIQSAGAAKTGGQTAKGSFATRAQSAAAKASNSPSAKK
jgi:hypothetical protein